MNSADAEAHRPASMRGRLHSLLDRVSSSRLRGRQVVRHALSRPRGAGYLRKWLVLGTLIGVVAGLGAVAFFSALNAGTSWLLGSIGGYSPAGTAGEGGIRAASEFA